MTRRVALCLALLLLPLAALGQRTGGSFGGSRWGSGAPAARPSPTPSRAVPPMPRPVARPTAPVVRAAYRAAPVSRAPVVRSAGRPVATTHVGIVALPTPQADPADAEAMAPQEPWDEAVGRAFGWLVAALCVVGLGARAITVRRWGR